MGYRPSDWENYYFRCIPPVEFEIIPKQPKSHQDFFTLGTAYEAGADAMLKCLIETSHPMDAGDYEDYWDTEVEWHHAHEKGKGYLVWIPDDAEKEEADGSTD